jgi:hypothetical protein
MRWKISTGAPVYWVRVQHWLDQSGGENDGRAGLAAILGGSRWTQLVAALPNVSAGASGGSAVGSGHVDGDPLVDV